jgi:hypothetical protein
VIADLSLFLATAAASAKPLRRKESHAVAGKTCPETV